MINPENIDSNFEPTPEIAIDDRNAETVPSVDAHFPEGSDSDSSLPSPPLDIDIVPDSIDEDDDDTKSR